METKTYTGKEFNATFKSEFVYIWKRFDEITKEWDYLYIGQTSRGIIRLLTHKKVNRIERIQDDDVIELLFPTRGENIRLVERALILKHKPLYCDDIDIHFNANEKRFCPRLQRADKQKRLLAMAAKRDAMLRASSNRRQSVVSQSPSAGPMI